MGRRRLRRIEQEVVNLDGVRQLLNAQLAPNDRNRRLPQRCQTFRFRQTTSRASGETRERCEQSPLERDLAEGDYRRRSNRLLRTTTELHNQAAGRAALTPALLTSVPKQDLMLGVESAGLDNNDEAQ